MQKKQQNLKDKFKEQINLISSDKKVLHSWIVSIALLSIVILVSFCFVFLPKIKQHSETTIPLNETEDIEYENAKPTLIFYTSKNTIAYDSDTGNKLTTLKKGQKLESTLGYLDEDYLYIYKEELNKMIPDLNLEIKNDENHDNYVLIKSSDIKVKDAEKTAIFSDTDYISLLESQGYFLNSLLKDTDQFPENCIRDLNKISKQLNGFLEKDNSKKLKNELSKYKTITPDKTMNVKLRNINIGKVQIKNCNPKEIAKEIYTIGGSQDYMYPCVYCDEKNNISTIYYVFADVVRSTY